MTGAEQRELGVLATKMSNLESKFEEHRQETRDNRQAVQSELRDIKVSVQSVLDKMNGWRGGWKAMSVVGVITSAITTIVLQIIPLWHK